MNNYFIILAAGLGKRFSKKKPKQYFLYKNKELFEHSVDKAIKSKLFKKVVLVTDNQKKKIRGRYLPNVLIIKGGKERCDSSLIALKRIKRYRPNNVLIHDAARPNFSTRLLKKILKELNYNKSVVPISKPKDSLKYKFRNQIFNLKRENSYLSQTPQGFKFNELYNLALNEKDKVSDEASLFVNRNKKIKFITGESKNIKITFKEDIENQKTYFGIGFDLHKLIKGKKLYLGGEKIPFHSGLKGHSDGDVILHAIIDAILGAMRKKDIGSYFPNTKKFKDIRSPKMLKPILESLNKSNFIINNLDINLICEQPKVSKYRNKIINSISKLMTLNKSLINLKGKTVEKLGLIGKEKAIACEVIISITKYD